MRWRVVFLFVFLQFFFFVKSFSNPTFSQEPKRQRHENTSILFVVVDWATSLQKWRRLLVFPHEELDDTGSTSTWRKEAKHFCSVVGSGRIAAGTCVHSSIRVVFYRFRSSATALIETCTLSSVPEWRIGNRMEKLQPWGRSQAQETK